MPVTLGLAGDLDDVDLIEDIEAAFGIRLNDDEIERCWTVGHLFELVEARLPDASTGGGATAMTFYRLRRALQPRLVVELRPNSPISELGRLSVRRLHRIIEDECGLRPPSAQLSMWGCFALVLIAAFPISALALDFGWWIAVGSTVPPLALYRIAPIRLPNDMKTIGDLVRVIASRNIGALSQQGARLRTSEAWDSFREVVAGHTELPTQEIARDTLILAPA